MSIYKVGKIKSFLYPLAGIVLTMAIWMTAVLQPAFARPDDDAPVIVLNGASTITLLAGETYTDPGATAVDDVDGVVDVVSTAPEFITTNPGNWVISYAAMDAANNVAWASRNITIQAPAEYYQGVARFKKIKDNRVKVYYKKNGKQKLTLPFPTKMIGTTSDRDQFIVLNRSLTKLAVMDAYTGELTQTIQTRKNINEATRVDSWNMDVYKANTPCDEIVLATTHRNQLKVAVWSLNHKKHTVRKVDQTSITMNAAVESNESLLISTKQHRLTVKHGEHTYRWKMTRSGLQAIE